MTWRTQTETCTCAVCGRTWQRLRAPGQTPRWCPECRPEARRQFDRERRRRERVPRDTDWPLDRCGHDVRIDTWSLVSRVRCRECGVTELRGGVLG